MTDSASPVMNRASSETRNATARATSSGVWRRQSGVASTHDWRTSSGVDPESFASHSNSRDCMGVATKPGHTQVTVMWCYASSNAIAWVNPSTPNFEAT